MINEIRLLSAPENLNDGSLKRYQKKLLCRCVIHVTPPGFRFIFFWFATNISLLSEFSLVHLFLLHAKGKTAFLYIWGAIYIQLQKFVTGCSSCVIHLVLFTCGYSCDSHFNGARREAAEDRRGKYELRQLFSEKFYNFFEHWDSIYQSHAWLKGLNNSIIFLISLVLSIIFEYSHLSNQSVGRVDTISDYSFNFIIIYINFTVAHSLLGGRRVY